MVIGWSTCSNREAFVRLLRAEFQRERNNDFSMLRRIPSTNVRKFLGYFSKLDDENRDALAEGLAERAFLSFFPTEMDRRNTAWKRYVGAKIGWCGWEYQDVRSLRAWLSIANREPDLPSSALLTDDIRKWIENIKPVKSAEIRKVVRLALSQIIKPLTVTHGDQYWEYEGELNGKGVSVKIDYSHRHHQLDYWVSTLNRKLGMWGVNYERLMGLAFASWDLLEQTNLDQSIALLKEHVTHCAEFLHRLPSEYFVPPKP